MWVNGWDQVISLKIKKLRREGLDLHRLLALVDNTTVVAMQQCNI